MRLFVRLLILLRLAAFSISVIADEPSKPSESPTTAASLRDLLVSGLDAVSAKELDAPLAKLTALQKQAQANMNHPDPDWGLIQSATDILLAYQDGLLGNKPRGNESGVERLQQTAANLGARFAELIPRSELMEKIQFACGRISGEPTQRVILISSDKRIGDLIRGIKKLDEMDGVMEQLDAMENQARLQGKTTNNEISSLFRNYCRTYHELRDGQATSLSFSSTYAFNIGADAMVGVRDLLTRFALPRVLETPANLVQKEGESTLGFLRRVIATARTTSNWPLLSRALDAARTMGFDTVVSYEDSNGLQNFLGGLNQEEARFWSGAVTSYLAALKSGSQMIPADYIGKRLEEIRQQHPEDYDAGAKVTPSPYGIEQRVGRTPPNLLQRQRALSIPGIGRPTEPPPSPKSPPAEEKPAR